ncbi:hypothetical protein [Mycoplasmopsis gallopavonis]|uniref:Spermidine/putrescine-binding periplasmic protein n=1 Tax=Mycoplasmopsis gallopavonis TaxID=76629 RepID=A0A449B068_9BACT|nr:hypothetical protein [Mycoplasmopsis gallopavonis]RIV16259.1 hypothetical protein D1113_03025 [Mycoplasmopsis gallopavonis]VEU73134.1 Uncharacterised protein [Mycoplasmopsis gallopavonis]
MKTYKKWILPIITISALASTVLAAFSYKISHPFKPSFYNYKSYMSDDNQDYLRETFQYKAFDEINEFSKSLINNKAVAGIGSDFQAINLIKEGLITQIDYSVLLDDPSLTTNDKIKSALRKLYRPEIWNHLESYNKYLKEDPNTYNYEFWQFFVPYYSQDAIVGYNIQKLKIPNELKKDNSDELDFDKAAQKMNLPKNKSHEMINILKSLQKVGVKHYTITDAIRDNMLYATSYWKLPDGSRVSDRFTGEVSNKTYLEMLNYFGDLIKDGTGFAIKDSNAISLKGDSLEIIRDLLNPNFKSYSASIMYNGDAMNAYYSDEHFSELEPKKQVRGIKPKHNILLVDGLVVAKATSLQNRNRYLKVLSNSIYENLKNKHHQIKETNNLDSNKLTEKLYLEDWKRLKTKELESLQVNSNNQEEFIKTLLPLVDLSKPENNQILNDFYQAREKHEAYNIGQLEHDVDINDRINFMPKIIANWLLNQKSDLLKQISNTDFQPQTGFEKAVQALFNNYKNPEFLEIYNNANQEKQALILARILATLNLQNELIAKENKYIDNFNYVRYVPIETSLYELVLRNYFMDVTSGQDQKVIEIYEIINNSNNIHKALGPVDKKLQSKISIEYFNLTKS